MDVVIGPVRVPIAVPARGEDPNDAPEGDREDEVHLVESGPAVAVGAVAPVVVEERRVGIVLHISRGVGGKNPPTKGSHGTRKDGLRAEA